uniref:Transmembrane protein n=1 Tax=Globodera pallida TaxID=36090 RepID=A0A183BLW2_GLOPA
MRPFLPSSPPASSSASSSSSTPLLSSSSSSSPDFATVYVLCCCVRLHRHQLHLASYGFVSMSLIATGFVFTVFAIFHKDSQIGKIWLAGPVLIVVGAVLCGKVMIDWGPAMRRGRADSLDSQLMDELVFSNLIPIGAKARLSLLTGGTVAEAAAATAESANMTTPRFSSPSVASFTTTDQQQQQQQHNSSSNHRFLLPTDASAGGPIYPNNNNNNGIAKTLLFSNSRSWCPFPATPPPLCALYGSSSSASSMCSHKSAPPATRAHKRTISPLTHYYLLTLPYRTYDVRTERNRTEPKRERVKG